jgi:hypothetical protein
MLNIVCLKWKRHIQCFIYLYVSIYGFCYINHNIHFPERTLQIDPQLRPDIFELCDMTGALAAAMSVDLLSPVDGLDLPIAPNITTQSMTAVTSSAPLTANVPQPSSRSSASMYGASTPSATTDYRNNPSPAHSAPSAPSAGAVFGALRGQGMSLFKNLKDTSAKVVQTVQVSILCKFML